MWCVVRVTCLVLLMMKIIKVATLNINCNEGLNKDRIMLM